MTHLRVAGEDAGPSTFAEAAQQALTRALAMAPVAMVLLIETAEGISWLAVPDSAALVRGMGREMHDELEPQPIMGE